MRLHSSVTVAGITITVTESVFWTAHVIVPQDTATDRVLYGDPRELTDVSHDGLVKQIADLLTTLMIRHHLPADDLKPIGWLVEPMRSALFARAAEIDRALTYTSRARYPESWADMSAAADRCLALYNALRVETPA